MPSPDASSTLRHPAALRQPGFVSFLRARWRGEVALGRALWWDMWCVGTLVNLVAALAGLLLLASDGPALVGAAVYFAPLPYNLLLLLSVCRSAARTGDSTAGPAQLLATLWFVLAVLL